MNDLSQKCFLQQCPTCKKPFTLKCESQTKYNKDGQYSKTWREPHLLTCGHPICSLCIRSKEKGQLLSIVCDVCKVESELFPDQENLLRFPHFTYLLGSLYQNRYTKRGPELMKQKFISISELKKKNQGIQETVICSNCNDVPATYRCDTCNAMTCDKCYVDVHNKFERLKAHKPIPIHKSMAYRITEMCEEHKRLMEFYCVDDDMFCCSICIKEYHDGHNTNAVVIRNKAIADEVKESIQDLKLVRNTLKNSFKQLKSSKPNKNSNSTAVTEIRTAFSYLHGYLQLRENELIEKAQVLNDNLSESPSYLAEELQTNMKFVDTLISDYQRSLENQSHQVYDYYEMLEQIKNASVLPCQLHKVKDVCDDDGKIRFNLNDDVVKNYIETIGEIESRGNARSMELIPLDKENSNCLHDVDIDDDDDDDDDDDVEEGEENTTSSLRAVSLAGSSKESVGGKHEVFTSAVVYCAYVIHPGHFYVHKEKDLEKLQKLQQKLDCFANSGRAQCLDAPPISGDLCLAMYSMDKKWYRGRVLSTRSELAKLLPLPDDRAEVNVPIIYIDYGNCSYVPLSNIRVLPDDLLTIETLTLKCSLHDIVPISSEGWDHMARMTFHSLMETAECLHLRVYEEKSDTFYVDIFRISNELQQSSIREALITLRLASLATNVSAPFESSLKYFDFTTYYMPKLPSVGKRANVYISHVDTPHCFYIQVIGDETENLNKIQTAFQEIYKSEEADRMAVYIPTVGLPCAAKYNDGLWYRARIESPVDDDREVEIFYVDFGNKRKVKWTELRTVEKSFLKYPGIAIKCMLADIAPVKRQKFWSKEANECFKKKIDSRTPYLIEVMDTIKSEIDDNNNNLISVKLIHRDVNGDECVNFSLVKDKVAASKGLCATPDALGVRSQDRVKKSVVMSMTRGGSCCTGLIQEPFLERYNSLNPQNMLMAALTRPHSIAKSGGSSSSCSIEEVVETEEELDPIATSETAFVKINTLTEDLEFEEAEGKISYAESPSCIYFQPFLARQDCLQIFMLDLQRIYKHSLCDADIEWNAGDSCVAFHSKYKEWYRGLINIVNQEEKLAEVCFIDYGYTEHCTFKNLREISSEFTEVHPFAILCHLSTIKAAGDRDEWSAMACERMTELISEHDEFIVTILGPAENNNSYPVDFSYFENVFGGALVGDQIVKRSLSEYLLDKGMALPVKKLVMLETVEEVDDDNNSTSEDNILNDFVKSNQNNSENENNVVVYKSDIDMNSLDINIDETESSLDFKHDEESDDDDEDSEGSLPTRSVGNSQNNNFVVHSQLWRKSSRPTEKKFVCKVTYVHDDGTIYVQDVKDSKDLCVIQKGLETKYSGTKPSHEDSYWHCGNICIAFVDNVWCRATVIDNNEDDHTYSVQLLDYGKYATVSFTSLRKRVVCTDLPPLAYKCVLADVKSKSDDGIWPDDVIDYFREMLILNNEKHEWTAIVSDTVTGKNDDVSRIILSNGKDTFNDILLRFEFAEKVSRELSSSEEDDIGHPVATIALHSCPLPDVNYIMPITVTNVEDDLMVYIQRKYILDPDSIYAQVTNAQLHELTTMNKYLTEHFMELDVIESARVEDIVTCRFSEDGGSYRGRVESRTNDDVFTVLFVDYGNREETTLENLRKLPKNFLNLPMQSFLCQIHQIKLPKTNLKLAKEKLKSSITAANIDDESELFAQIKDVNEPIKVDLLMNKKGKLSLLYQHLIDENVIHLVREKTMAETL